ncbi:MAG: GTP-binding protein TypA/BipA [uncultured Gemmatimonadetes bacterium]|uniref:Large ribosomal subunit assembly factor BipA n=1 Tax=uncultured Gemmatimonadota bacterium TaxID=203437 RepID=A0A6J4KFI3_9BACT|nr:MAG: GTP-binding protein TypA/BipA [uncultured Gemmatimonadota bacterium]
MKETSGHTESYMPIRNIAIIAHVDHGKTTLVDHMLRQAGTFRENQQVAERVMDSNPLERERGITILAKNLSVRWADTKINIVDTPGHSDFGGEVERILRMVDGVVLLVDAAEGPMPQTRFVTRKALELGLQPVVIINKIDRGDADPHRVHDEVLELFMELEAEEHQLDCPFLYAVGREGVAMYQAEDERKDLTPLFDTIVKTIPAPTGEAEGPFQMLVSTIDYSPYLGRLAIGRIERGVARVGEPVILLEHGHEGDAPGMARARISKLFSFEGLERREAESASAGDVVAVAGLPNVDIGSTICDPEHPEALQGIAVEEPTVSVDLMVNSSPFAGREGKYVTSRQIRDRLMRELESNVALRVEDTDSPDTMTVSGRGELHLGILMETMRREGYEFAVSRPRVILKKGPGGELMEPYEEVTVDVPENLMGPVIEKFGQRRAEMLEMKNPGGGLVRLVYRVPARGLFGYRSEFLTDTRGEGQLHHRFLEYGPYVGTLSNRNRGVLVSMLDGESVAFALGNLQERSTFFIAPGVPVYEGMVVGENSRQGDMEVNVCKGKKLTNMRASGSDDNVLLEPPRVMTLEDAMGYIADDELIEVTPKSLRLRKRLLNASDRKKASRASA